MTEPELGDVVVVRLPSKCAVLRAGSRAPAPKTRPNGMKLKEGKSALFSSVLDAGAAGGGGLSAADVRELLA